MTTEHEIPTDYFGNEMAFVESYGRHLPESDHIPTADGWHGITGITHDGDMYCLDCAEDMDIIEITHNRCYAKVDGELVIPKDALWTGIVQSTHETDVQHHCGRGADCLNAVEGSDHPYNHDCKVGIGIEQRVLQH